MNNNVEEVKSKVDIVTIIGERVDLKKAGRNFKANCPFHSEKSPSFVVSPEMQIFKCFGCGESGDVYSFLEKFEGMEFYEALKYLADRVGVKLTDHKGTLTSKKDHLYTVNMFAKSFYSWVLLNHRAGEKAYQYFKKDRGLKDSTIKEFGLGFSPETPFALERFLVQKKKLHVADLVEAGLLYKGARGNFDRFAGRAIFPLADHRDNIVGFAGRLLPGARADLAKYINTPETPIYHKSSVLFGLNISKREIKNKDYAIVVEGELDMIVAWQAGYKNTVALKGSAFTQEQVKLLSRFTKRIILALDADLAGDAAARRGIEIAQKEDFEIKVVQLGDFKDPDEMIRKDKTFFGKKLKTAIGIWDFILSSIFSKYNLADGNAKGKVSDEVIPVLASIDDKIVQAHYVQKVAEKLDVPVEAVIAELQQGGGKDGSEKSVKELVNISQKKKDRTEILEERLLAILFAHNPKKLADEKYDDLFESNFAKRVVEEFRKYIGKNVEFDPSDFAGTLSVELVEGFLNIILKEIKGLEDANSEIFENEIKTLTDELLALKIKKMRDRITLEIKKFENQKDNIKLKEAKIKYDELTKNLSRLEVNSKQGIIREGR